MTRIPAKLGLRSLESKLLWGTTLVLCVVMIAVIAAAALWWIVTQVWRLTARRRKDNPSR